MGFRTVVISSHSKLEYSLNYLVFKTVDQVKRINLDEIQTLIIESTAVSITSSLLCELVKKKIKVIFCDEKRDPLFETIPYYGDSISYKRICEQINWNQDIKDLVWKEIVKEKIIQQANVIKKINTSDYKTMIQFSNEVILGDLTNREGHAAKYYFNRVYGEDFNRNNSDKRNVYLNYGYSLILSQVNRAIVSKGYLTQLGIHHRNTFNQFNLSCDLMEPLRPIIDNKVFELNDENFKEKLIALLTETVIINAQKQTLTNAINIYVSSVLNALNNEDCSQIKFIESYE